MNYSDFCKLFYSEDKHLCKLKIKQAKHRIAKIFIENAVKKGTENEITSSEEYYIKFFSGERPLSFSMCETIVKKFDKKRITNFFNDNLNETALPQLMS